MHLYIVLILLAVFQGIAEFLPISSSGHLVILEQIDFIHSTLEQYGKEVNMLINVALHVATLVAVLIYMRKDIYKIAEGFLKGIFTRNMDVPGFRTGLYILAASLPAGVIGVLFNDLFEELFSSSMLAFFFLIINGIILISTKRIKPGDRKLEQTGFSRAVIIGFFQALAMIPGISRSGMTIAGGMYKGLEPVEAARFSFLMAIPVIGGAGLLEGAKAAGGSYPVELFWPLVAAMVVAIIVALLSIRILFWFVKQIRLDVFGYYTIAVGSLGLLVTGLF